MVRIENSFFNMYRVLKNHVSIKVFNSGSFIILIQNVLISSHPLDLKVLFCVLFVVLTSMKES